VTVEVSASPSRRWQTIRIGALGAAATATILTSALAAPASAGAGRAVTGPSTTTAPYVRPVTSEASVTSLLTVGDRPADNGARLVGVPDGIGLYRSGSSVTALVNHELQPTAGSSRAHGQKGAFVSSWSIDPRTLRVSQGSDLIRPGVRYWDYSANAYSATPGAPTGAAAGTHCGPCPLMTSSTMRGARCDPPRRRTCLTEGEGDLQYFSATRRSLRLCAPRWWVGCSGRSPTCRLPRPGSGTWAGRLGRRAAWGRRRPCRGNRT
jgi:hypothetical protein